MSLSAYRSGKVSQRQLLLLRVDAVCGVAVVGGEEINPFVFFIHFQVTFGVYLTHQLPEGSTTASVLSAGSLIQPEPHSS